MIMRRETNSDKERVIRRVDQGKEGKGRYRDRETEGMCVNYTQNRVRDSLLSEEGGLVPCRRR